MSQLEKRKVEHVQIVAQKDEAGLAQILFR